MATGLEMYDALRAATRGLPAGSVYVVNAIEARDLGKLTVDDLLSRGYARKVSEEVSSALLNGDLSTLGRSMGLQLQSNYDVARLLPE